MSYPYLLSILLPPPLVEKGTYSVTLEQAGMISVIIPFYNAAAYLEVCLEALRRSEHQNYELILVNDGSSDASPKIARRYSERVLSFSSPRGPAFARNRGAEAAKGDILFFIDADIICFPDTLGRVGEAFAADRDLAAVIGSYDDAPPAANFVSRYKNLTHHFVHQNASSSASTFWTGCGAIKRSIFQEFSGFDESFQKPSIEDIELGYRLRARGHKITLCKQLIVKHAKRWTFTGLLRSDIFDRAIPWTVLQLSYGGILNDLNVGRAQRASLVFACLAALSAVLSLWNLWFLAGTAAALLPVLGWNRRLYRFYHSHGGPWFCLRAVAMHWLYYLYSALAFAVGCLQYCFGRRLAREGGSRNPEGRMDRR